jgi:protein-S-isoprenylcysteine O-methyltransferase Ste14
MAVSGGPYRVVRHPMYVGMVVMYSGMNLILGSLWAFTVVGAILALLVWRTAMEDATLMRELPGYSDYATQTRWRLIPGVW